MNPQQKLPVRRLIIDILVGLTGIAAFGCSHALSRAMPEVKGPLAVRVSPEPALRFGEMPVFVYQVPDTSVYVAGHEGMAQIGALFGPIGVVTAIATARATGESKVRDHEAQLRLDLRTITEQILVEELSRRGQSDRFGPASGGGNVLEIRPYLVVNFVGNEHVRLWVVLKTAFKDAQGDERWKTKYAAGVGETRTLGGASGWASDDGAPLRKAVDRNLRLAMDALLTDASGALARGSGRLITVNAQWVWAKGRSQRVVEVLKETADTLVVIPQVTDDMFFAGVSILDKKSIAVAPEGQ